MPWQTQVLDVAGELLTDDECARLALPPGTPAYREVWVTVPRQSGKTTLVLVLLIDRCILWEPFGGRAARCLYTAQTGKAARKKLLNDMVPLMQAAPPVAKRMGRVKYGVGAEQVPFLNGARIEPGNNTESAAHGETLDFACIDEAFDDTDDRREQAIFPAIATRPWAQVLGTSTAGTAASLYLARKMRLGRAAAAADTGRGLAYFEWSAPETADPADEQVWWDTHPALGITVSIEVMRHAHQSMSPEQFKRAWLNIPTERVTSQHIPPSVWRAVCDPTATAMSDDDQVGLRWVFDVGTLPTGEPSRPHTAIAVHNPATATVELVDYAAGTSWVTDRLDHLTTTHGGTVAYSADGPAAALGRTRPDWRPITAADNATASVAFHAAVLDGSVRVRAGHDSRHEPSRRAARILDTALAGAEQARIGDRWRWSRSQSSTDVAPLVAVTLAAGAEHGPAPAHDPFVII